MSKAYLLGPLTLKFGMKSCVILVAQEKVIVRYYSGKESTKVGLSQELGFKQPFSELLDKEIDSNQVSTIIKNSEYKTHLNEEIDALYVAYKMGKNQIQLALKTGDIEKYSILQRHKTEKYLQILTEIFPEKTKPVNKPVTWWQKALNY